MHKLVLFLLFLIATQSIVAQKADQEEIKLLLDRHNSYREEVGIPPIEYSEELAEIALSWAENLAENNCAFEHSNNSYGENLFRGTTGYYTVGDAVDSWGAEKKFYNYKKNLCEKNEVCGHYTQIVWKTTTQVGCAKNICDGYVTWVCNYNPPGNFIGVKPY